MKTVYEKIRELCRLKGEVIEVLLDGAIIHYHLGDYIIQINNATTTPESIVVCVTTLSGDIIYANPYAIRGAQLYGLEISWPSDPEILERIVKEFER